MKLINTINKTDFNFPGQQSIYRGKVREVYTKGQILNQIATKMMHDTSDLVPNWIIATPDPNVAVGHLCKPFKVEMVIRGYLSGHAAREYRDGKRFLCCVPMPEGMKENDKFPEPIITPSTKADGGMHDEDISREDILKKGIVSQSDYEVLEKYTHALYRRGSEIAAKRGLILVDTKYEFGKTKEGKIVLIDEIHTPDSSRYFYADGYAERQRRGEAQKQLSKEFVRQWLIANGFQGKTGQQVPEMTDEKILEISDRYIELYENITGEKFMKSDTSDILGRIEKNVTTFLAKRAI